MKNKWIWFWMMSLTALIFVVAYRLTQLSEEPAELRLQPAPAAPTRPSTDRSGKTQGVLDDRAFYFV